MNKVENNIVRLLTGKEHLDEVSVDELQTITNEHPYFSVAQLLLTKKMKQDNHPGFTDQLQKTAVYFPNTHWLHYQLSSEEEHAKKVNGSSLHQPAEKEEEVLTADEIEQNNLAEEGLPDGVIIVEPVENESLLQKNSIDDDDFFDDDETIEPITDIEEAEEISFEEKDLVDENTEATFAINQSEPEVVNFHPAENKSEEIETEMTSHSLPHEDEEEIEMPIVHSVEAEAESKEEPELPVLDEEEIEANAEDEPLPVNTRLSEMLEEQAAALKKPVEEEAKLPIETEPYHTVDYFESQGIKLENQSQDKLGTKVRKFTDWLKQMKRINPQPSDLGSDPAMEHIVQDIAESSNQTKEIVTEAMAEVLKKQGKTDKAIQLYTKLSFQNPDKSAYFAAKIQELKGI